MSDVSTEHILSSHLTYVGTGHLAARGGGRVPSSSYTRCSTLTRSPSAGHSTSFHVSARPPHHPRQHSATIPSTSVFWPPHHHPERHSEPGQQQVGRYLRDGIWRAWDAAHGRSW
eukprot:1902184-Rhodomonas_salina.4